jgi:hypothetical protein
LLLKLTLSVFHNGESHCMLDYALIDRISRNDATQTAEKHV